MRLASLRSAQEFDTTTNSTYYFNTVTDETQWERPTSLPPSERKATFTPDDFHAGESHSVSARLEEDENMSHY